MSFSTPGNTLTQRLVFNTGTIDFGTNRLVDLANVTLGVEFQLISLYVINSIKPADIARHSMKVSLAAKLKTYTPELENLTLGSSTAGTPSEIDALDGQASYTNPIVTFFDRNGKEIQYQFIGAVIKSSKVTLAAEAYAEWDIEVEAKDIIELYTV